MRLAVLAVLLMPAVLSGLERLAAPDARLADPVWDDRAQISEIAVDQRPWAVFLERYRRPGTPARIDYAAVTPEDRAALDAHIEALGALDPRRLDRGDQLAYWIDLYNAATVALVLGHYPVESIRDIGSGLFDEGPWDREVVEVLGRPLTLNDIEHGIIRPVFAEPRIHYAVNCAALGCPTLAPEPWSEGNLDDRLAAAERAFVNGPHGVRQEDGALVLSKIWLWFREDFAGNEADMLDRLRAVAEGEAAEALAGRAAADRYAYDWSLNDAAR